MYEGSAIILENKRIAEGIYSLTFATEEEVKVRAGQFCMIGVQGYPLRRPIAVCMAEGERITVCYQVKGGGTRTLAETYRAGEKLSVLLPLGNGFPDEGKKIALIGGGAGIFPLIAVMRERTDSEIFAYMGFRSKSAVCMRYEMERFSHLTLSTDDGSLGYHGTAVQAFMEDIKGVQPDVIFSCGPTPMLRALKSAVENRKIPTYVSLEERMGCGIGACLVCVCEREDGSRARVCKDGPVFPLGSVKL